MDLINKIKGLFQGEEGQEEFENLILQSLEEYNESSSDSSFYDIKISKIPTYTSIVKDWPDEKKVDFIIYCVRAIHLYNKGRNSYSTANTDYQLDIMRKSYISHLLKAKIILPESDIVRLIENFSKYKPSEWSDLSKWPLPFFLNQVTNQYKGMLLKQPTLSALEKLKKKIRNLRNRAAEKEHEKLVQKIDDIIFYSNNEETAVKPILFAAKDPFATFANQRISDLPLEDAKVWYQLIALAQKANGSKPRQKFLNESKKLIDELGTNSFKKIVNEWFLFVIDLKEEKKEYINSYWEHEYTYTEYHWLSSSNTETIKGFVWMCAHFHDQNTVQNIIHLAEYCYRKIPGKGPASAAIGNACFFTLYKSKGLTGIQGLSKLNLRIKQSSAQKRIRTYLEEAARNKGISVYEIEDLAVDNFGLEDGQKEVVFDEVKAVLHIVKVGKTALNWYKKDGKMQKSIPAIVQRKHAEKLKRLKATKKKIEQNLVTQRDRIDRLFRTNRTWSFEDFQQFYLQHGLMSFLAKKLIWIFTSDGKQQTAIHLDGSWRDVNQKEIIPPGNCQVTLWHPAEKTTEEVKNWREFLIGKEIQQPLKQAFREVYLITEAELSTSTYSNRMAAHVLKQHQFNSLAKIRGWKYALMGAYDDGRYNEAATLQLEDFGLRAEYWINELSDEEAFNDAGIWYYITTDQVRFISLESEGVVELKDIPAKPFSEVMRDVDLFVGVASVGNDPTWQDSGGITEYRNYWASFAFGELSEIAKNRRTILDSLVPRLKIKKVAEVKDKFLFVRGKLRTYKIHIGSTNILMEPNDQYLCIVPDRSKKDYTEKLFIPFEGDRGLSIILSKAFLLAEDDKITDRTITSQILRK